MEVTIHGVTSPSMALRADLLCCFVVCYVKLMIMTTKAVTIPGNGS